MTHASMLTHLAAHNGIAWEDLDADTARELRAMLTASAPSSTAAPRSGAEPARGAGAFAGRRACWDCRHGYADLRSCDIMERDDHLFDDVSAWTLSNCAHNGEPLPTARNCPGWAPREAGEVSEPSDLVTALRTVAAAGVPVDLWYHPDADPGDGSGWVLVIGETHNYGGLDVLAAHAVKRAGEVSDG